MPASADLLHHPAFNRDFKMFCVRTDTAIRWCEAGIKLQVTWWHVSDHSVIVSVPKTQLDLFPVTTDPIC